MKEGEERIYRNRKIYLNAYGEYCVCHVYSGGGMVAYNAGFDSEEKAMFYIDLIVVRKDLVKQDFQELANHVKSVQPEVIQE